ncbi:uncharacterized protein LOC123558200 [Mercenaria mercenaria]|uniref:uncharacterized protein LOC123558200 n=1 Tax=Mercenaria mercenaria TaxID=6596 RepID=UPI00234F6D26|nr:uncharacterized protein LOC123558200 [Mercenaria mercenaria]
MTKANVTLEGQSKIPWREYLKRSLVEECSQLCCTVPRHGSTPRELNTSSKSSSTTVTALIRRILKIRCPKRISKEELWTRTKQKSVILTIEERKWRWLDHILRREQTTITHQALVWNPQGKRKRGRPAQTWRRTLDAELRQSGFHGARQRRRQKTETTGGQW